MIAALTFAGNFVFLSAVTMSCYRYPADFLGPLATLAACGILGLSTVPGGIPRMVSLSMLPPLLAWSVCALVFQVFSVAQSAELFDVRRPADFARAGSLFNQASYHLEQWRHDGPRGLEITALLPAGRTGQVEPLVVAGDDGALDFLYLNYVTPDDVQIGFEAMGRGGLQSPTVKIDYRQPHRFEVRYGSFLPPDNHPSLRSLSPADRDLARRMITVLLDGRIVMDGWADFHLPRARIFIGESPDNPAFGAAFTGKILGVNRPLLTTIPSPAQLKPGGYGPLAFTAVLQPMPIGVFDPLVSFGQLQQGAQLLVEHLSSTQVRIVWLDTAKREISGEPFIWPAGKKLEVEIEAGSLLPPATSGIWPGNPSPAEKAERKQRLRVSVDGRTVFQVRCEAPEASPATVAVGQDLLALRGGVMPALNEVPAQIRRLPW